MIATFFYDGSTPCFAVLWDDNSSDETGFQVYFNGGNGVFDPVAGIRPANDTSVVISFGGPVAAGITCQFYVKALKGAESSAQSNTASAKTQNSVFAAPTGVTGTVMSETSIRVAWTDNSSTEDGYEIWMAEAGGASTYLGDRTFYQLSPVTITGLSPKTTYRFKLRAYKGDPRTYTAFSAESPIITTPFIAPTNLAITGFSASSVSLSWKDNSAGETSYEILSRPFGVGNFAVRAIVGGTGSTMGGTLFGTVEKLTPNARHEFMVRAKADTVSPGTVSANSNTVSQITGHKITSAHYAQTLVNQPFAYTLTTSAPSLQSSSITNLPDGLTYDPGTRVISGSPTSSGVFQASMQVVFPDSSFESTILAIRVLSPPVATTTVPDQNLVTGSPASVPLADKFADPEATSAVRVSTSLGDMDLVLFEAQTPMTVANFESYMASGAYTDNLFHRSAVDINHSNFVIQGGAFKVDPSAPQKFTSVPTPDTVQNEPGISNIRGTVAMAKLGGDPHSATCQWFVNLNNNGLNLDFQNGGFTAFARVAGNGMAVADAIAAKPASGYNIILDGFSRFFDDWPLNTPEVLSVMDNSKVVKINHVTPVPVLTYAVTGNTNPAAVNPLVENGDVVLHPVDSGTSQVTVTATTLDGNTVSQTFEVTTISNVATLSALASSSGTLSPAFDSGTTNYTIAVPNDVTSITLTPATSSSHATVAVDAIAVASGSASQPLPLAVGDNTYYVDVLAEDGVTPMQYAITVKRSALALGSKFIVTFEEDGTVNIPLVRLGDATAAVDFLVTTSNGSATAPGDFIAIAGQQFTFSAGATSMDVPVTIVPTGATKPNLSFTVTIGSVADSMSAPETATVVIVDSVADTSNPSVSISAPAAGATFNMNPGATLNITGTAADNRGVKQVQVLFNGVLLDAILNPPPALSPTSTNYSLTVTPTGGTNTISVKSVDFRNRESSVVTRTFKVMRPFPVTVSDPLLGSVTTGFSPSSFREAGKSYTITATTKPPLGSFKGGLFTGWTIAWGPGTPTPPAVPATPQQSAARIGVALSSLEKNTLTFIYREGMILTANFIESPFKDLAGTYNGLIRPSLTEPDRAPLGGGVGAEDGSTRSNSTEGHFTATVQNTGAFSGKLTIDGFVLNIAGAFDGNGDARFGTSRLPTLTVARPNRPSLIVALKLNTAENAVDSTVDDKITGTVRATEFKKSVIASVSVVDSDRAFYNGTTAIVPAPYLGASNANGVFTAVLPARDAIDQPDALSEQDYPQGDGIGTVTITKAGVVTFAGTLADGTVGTASSSLSEIGPTHASRFALFAQLYNKLGFLSSFVTLDHTQTSSDMAATDVQWLRPFIGTSHYYPYGWPEVIKVDMMAAKYAAVTGQSVLKAANGANIRIAGADGNAELSLSDGQLTEPLTKYVNLSTADLVTKVPDNDPTFTLAITRTTGGVSGTFAHTDDTVPSYKAVIYQKGPDAGAYGFLLTKQPVPINYTGESGGVSLIGQP